MQTTAVTHSTHSIVPATQKIKFVNCAAKLVMRKEGIHPKYYQEAKVFCKGEHVLTVSGTQEEYHVDVWSGNHPLYKGAQSVAAVDDGPLSRFNAKYEGMDDLLAVPDLGTKEVEGLEGLKKERKKKPKPTPPAEE